ncbi:MAG: sigma-70 family RNA polymerase sigma factor [Ktedonobacteraceae bacterium]|nr:sigma-70 family RNA polymerase sigma factor [Ktedonobacteraceae bacterium]
MTLKNPSQVELYGELLTNEEQYRKEVRTLDGQLTREQEQAYLERARNGEKEAREKLLESCLPYVMHLAGKYSTITRAMQKNNSMEYLDLVQFGNVVLVERFERALTKPNPMGYLRAAISGLLLSYIEENAYGIKVTRTKKNKANGAPFEVKSLDAPVSRENKSTRPVTYADILPAPEPMKKQERDYTLLYQAIETLPEHHREIVTCFYGLECAPELLTDIMNRQRLAQGKEPVKADIVSNTPKKNALASLKRFLEPVYASA